jgi:hypothetical protein
LVLYGNRKKQNYEGTDCVDAIVPFGADTRNKSNLKNTRHAEPERKLAIKA